MRKIDKSIILSKNYKTWLENLGKEHPKYNSSNNKYYNDIKMSLLYCQNGLCAYTEEALCDIELIKVENWDDEKYITDLSSQDLICGDLDHFDERLKDKQAWLWSNLFFVQGDINRKVKRDKPIKNILKPDANEYDEFKYLQFHHKTNEFIANVNLSQAEKDEVNHMIDVLGLNRVKFKRKRQILRIRKAFEHGLELEEPYEYITAWKMTLQNLKSHLLEVP